MTSADNLRSAAHKAAKLGNLPDLEKCIQAGANASQCVRYAGYYGQLKAIQFLMEHKANIDHTLSGAVHGGSTDGVEYAIEHKANLETRDELGNTPLCWAVRDGHTDIVQTLLLRKADSSVKMTTTIGVTSTLLEVNKWTIFRDGRNKVIRELLTPAPPPPAPLAPTASVPTVYGPTAYGTRGPTA
jgi:hypothetical protein